MFSVRLIGEFSVWEGAEELPPAPNRTVATLLLGLLANGDAWMSRQEVAKRLYPESDSAHAMVAVRQTLSRIKQWLGQDLIEDRQNCLRLTPGMCEADWDSIGGGLIAPGLNHPWAEAVRRERQTRADEPSDALHDNFARTVESAAKVDSDAARGILVGGFDLVSCLEPQVASRLLGLTEPKHRGVPFAFEHSELRGMLYYNLGAVRLAFRAQMRSFRMASQQKSQAKMARAASWAMFTEIESGSMNAAGAWMERASSFNRVSSMRVLLANAHATFLWNSHRLSEALKVMIGANSHLESVDRAQTVHYWANLALLAAEAGDIGLSNEAQRVAQSRIVPSLDHNFSSTLELSRGDTCF
jgi:hypothetical protein